MLNFKPLLPNRNKPYETNMNFENYNVQSPGYSQPQRPFCQKPQGDLSRNRSYILKIEFVQESLSERPQKTCPTLWMFSDVRLCGNCVLYCSKICQNRALRREKKEKETENISTFSFVRQRFFSNKFVIRYKMKTGERWKKKQKKKLKVSIVKMIGAFLRLHSNKKK